MSGMYEALGRFAEDNRWLIPFLGTASAVATFYFAGREVGLVFTVGILLVLFLAALNSMRTISLSAEQTAAAVEPLLVDTEYAAVPEGQTATDDANDQESGSLNTPEADNELHGIVDSAWHGEVTAVRAHLEELLATKPEGEERNGEIALHHALLVKAGDPKALGDLRQMVAEKVAPQPKILSWLATALSMVGEPQQAIDELISKSETFASEDRAEAVLHAARISKTNDRLAESAHLARVLLDDDGLGNVIRAQALAIVAHAVAPESPFAAMGDLERSLQLDPTQTDVRFSLAYLYADHGFDALAHHHYRVLDDTNAATAVAINNLGVVEASLGMRGSALERYKAAGMKGSGLAWANLASLLTDAGDFDGARSALEEGQKLDPNLARLIAARDSLSKAVAAEGDARNLAREVASQQRISVTRTASSSVDVTDSRVPGTWQLSNGVQLTIVNDGDSYKGTDKDGAWTLVLRAQGNHFTAAIRPGRYAAEVSGFGVIEPGRMEFIFATTGALGVLTGSLVTPSEPVSSASS